MPRPRQSWALLCVLLAACSLITDFDRDPSAVTTNEAGAEPGRGGRMDAQVQREGDASAPQGGEDAGGGAGDDAGGNVARDAGGNVGSEAGVVPDATVAPEAGADCSAHTNCPASQLCCNGVCIVASEARCSDCTQGCSESAANACRDRTCACGSAASCSGARPYCVTSGSASSCAECRDATDCAGRSDGRTECMAGNCAACNPSDNSGCNGNTPICDPTTFTCQACRTQPDDCPGALVCTASGACGGCGANDAADCTSPTTPICNLAASPTVCRGCASNAECMTELSRPYCVANQRCSTCNPANDMGCNAASNAPDCRLNGQGQYACQGCTSGSCPTSTRCDTASGRCVQCRADGDCDASSATPFCDTTSGMCRGCNAGATPNLWCSLYTLLGRPLCHASGRCVRCDGNQGCAAPTGRCYAPQPAMPQSNLCVECRPGVAGDCSGGTPFCGNNGRCRACSTAPNQEAMDCPSSSGQPVCDPTTGRCARCRLGGSGASAGCPGNQMCLMGASGPECGQCADDDDCPANNPICNTSSHSCRPCNQGEDSACAAKVSGTRCTARGRCELCDTSGHAPCGEGQLCCEMGGMATCVPTNNNRCMGCGMACPAGQSCAPGTRMCIVDTPPDPPDAGDPSGS